MNLLSVITPSEPEFNNTVHEIMNTSRYGHLKTGYGNFIDGFKEAVGKWILKILNRIFSNMSIGNYAISQKVSVVFMIIGILAILALIVIICVKINNSFEKRRSVREILGEKIDDSTTPNSLRKKAHSFRKQGDLRQSIRYEFIALLLLMHEKNILYLDDTKTNEEIYDYLKNNSFTMLKLFKGLSDIFNSSWYGHKLSEDNKVYWNTNMSLIWNEVIHFEIRDE